MGVCVKYVYAHLRLMKGYFVSPTAPPGFDELTCHCGASVIYPPVPCGTRPPECTQTCARVHQCDHPGGSHPLASVPYSLLTPHHLECCMMVFIALTSPCDGTPYSQSCAGLLLWRWVCDWYHSWGSQCPSLLYSADTKHT